jgi:alkylation response protein AidB-like acyl-CoA dehydrogenase
MLVDVEGARSAVYHGAWAVDAQVEDARLQAAVAKSHGCSAAVRVADKALFLHGAVGYTWEHDLQFPFKRIKSDAVLLGSPDAYRDLIAEDLDLVPAGRPQAPSPA